MTATVHDTAVVDPSAKLGEGVVVEPFAIIGADVEIGAGSWIGPHAVVHGPTTMGMENQVFQFASVGEDPQDKKYRGEPTTLVMGDRNTVRECVTINRGTAQDRGETTIGDENWIMAYVHIAHDCILGDNNILANCATLAGHVQIDSFVNLGGFTKVHQFCRIGRYSFCGMDSGIKQDVPPYVTASGFPAKPFGINSEGLRRNNFSPEQIANIKRAYKTLYRKGLRLEQACRQLSEVATSQPEVALLTDFLKDSARAIIR